MKILIDVKVVKTTMFKKTIMLMKLMTIYHRGKRKHFGDNTNVD